MRDGIRDLAIVYRPVDNLSNNPRNARKHSKRQIKQIAESIRVFGFTNPVLIDEKLQVIAGHGRLAAAKSIGLKTVPTVEIGHLSEDQKRAYVIADNRLAEKAGWDNDILKIELQHLIEIDTIFDVTITGFEIAEIDNIVSSEDAAEEKSLQPHVGGLAVSRAGDLWLLGPHRIYCGNALHAETYRHLLQSKPADLIITDPPYNVRINGHVSGQGKVRHREFAMASGEMDCQGFTEFLATTTRLMAANSRPGSVHFIFMDWRHQLQLLSATERVYHELLNMCVWAKTNAGMGSLYRSQHELVYVFRNGKARHRNNVELGRYGRSRTNVWIYPGASGLERGEEGPLLHLHPSVKPIKLIADAILDCSAPGDLVLDPFLGSGTTLLAAERVGRCCRGIEIDPLYVDLIIRRWQAITGGDAILSDTGERFNDRKPTETRHVG